MAWTVRQPSSRVPPRRVTGPAVGPNLNRGDADHRPQVDRRSNTRRRDASGGVGGRGVRARRKPPDRGRASRAAQGRVQGHHELPHAVRRRGRGRIPTKDVDDRPRGTPGRGFESPVPYTRITRLQLGDAGGAGGGAEDVSDLSGPRERMQVRRRRRIAGRAGGQPGESRRAARPSSARNHPGPPPDDRATHHPKPGRPGQSAPKVTSSRDAEGAVGNQQGTPSVRSEATTRSAVMHPLSRHRYPEPSSLQL